MSEAAPDHGEWKRQQNERARQLRIEDKLPQIREGGSNTPWTLAQAVILCAMCVFRGKNGAVPYPANSKIQIAWWEKQERDEIQNRNRTIIMNTAGCPPGTRELSPKITKMQYRGKTEEVAKKRKREGHEAKSRKQIGRDQKNSVEGVAIHLLLVFLRAVIPFFVRDWEAMPVFDGMKADFMMRRKDWEPDVWVPMQMKSASECVQGKKVTYNLNNGEYPHVFCVCVGMLGFVHRVADVTGPNDISNAPKCSIGEIWNIGSCSNIEKSLQPYYGVPYSKFSASHRLHFSGAADEAKRTFAEKLLRDVEAWPNRLERNQVLYDFSATINKNAEKNISIEKSGFKVVDAALRTCGMRIDPVWRQNECVDYAVVSIDSGKPLVFVSGKTARVSNEDPKQRRFDLSGAPNKLFCDVVVASYSGAYHRVAVIRRNTAYVDRKKYLCWNEDCLDPGVRVFDDIRVPEVAKAFADYILSFGQSS
jgi:hypothetical protein